MALVKIPEQKIILCGEYGVGKSSLFRRFTTNTFTTSTDRQSTLGLDHYEKAFHVRDKEIKVICYRVQLCVYLLTYVLLSEAPIMGHWWDGKDCVCNIKLL